MAAPLISQSLPTCRSPPPEEPGRAAARPTGKPGRSSGGKFNGHLKRLREGGALREAFEYAGTRKSISPEVNSLAYGHLPEGALQFHAQMVKRGFDFTQSSGSHLLTLYTSCGSLDLACQIFDVSSHRKSLVSWNQVICRCARSGLVSEALTFFSQMRDLGFSPDQFTFSAIFHAVDCHRELGLGQQLHSLSVKLGLGGEEFVSNSLIKMYASCGNLADSMRVFGQISDKNSAVAWNSMMARLLENGFHEDALELYRQMQRAGVKPTPPTFSSVLNALAGLEAAMEGAQVHAQMVIHGFSSNLILQTALLDLYTKCGNLESGKKVFRSMNSKNAVAWNTMIRAYSQMGLLEEALHLFSSMRKENLSPDEFTFPAVLLGAASSELASKELESLHAQIIKAGLEIDPFVAASLISMYSAFQKLEDARLAFHDAGWIDAGLCSSMISACMKNEGEDEVLGFFVKMLEMGIEPSNFIISSLFTACAHLSALVLGTQIHAYTVKRSYPLDVAAKNSLLTMYSCCGCIGEAVWIFDSIKAPSLISFNSMISAFAHHGRAAEGWRLFQRMQADGQIPDEATFLALLSAFNHAGWAREGLTLLNSMRGSHGLEPTYRHHACVIDMLARSGEIEEAMKRMKKIPMKPEPSLWRVVLGACSKHGRIEMGRAVAELLLEVEPDEASTYILLANTYSALGRREEAGGVWELMEERGIAKDDAASWIEVNGRTHVFRAGDRSHPHTVEIYRELNGLTREARLLGYEPGGGGLTS